MRSEVVDAAVLVRSRACVLRCKCHQEFGVPEDGECSGLKNSACMKPCVDVLITYASLSRQVERKRVRRGWAIIIICTRDNSSSDGRAKQRTSNPKCKLLPHETHVFLGAVPGV